LVRIKKPTEAIGDRFSGIEIVAVGLARPVGLAAVSEFYWDQCRPHLLLGKELMVCQRVIPLGQIFEI